MKRSYIKNWYKRAQTVFDYDKVDAYGNPVAADVEQMLADYNVEEDEGRITQYEGVEQDNQETVENLEQEKDDAQFELDVDRPWEPPDIDEKAPDTGNKTEALKYAIENRRVLEIIYSPAGRMNRKINFGKSIKRVIEPHNMFQAGNGNIVVTTWDRSVGKIRAFIVDRIMNIIFRKKAIRNPFKQRQRVLPSYERGKTMANKNNMLTKILSKESEDSDKGFNLNKTKKAGNGSYSSKKRQQQAVDRSRELGKRRQRSQENENRYQHANPPAETPPDDSSYSLDKARQHARERGRQLIDKRQRAEENEERYQQQNPNKSSADNSLIKIASELESKGLSKSSEVVKEVNDVLNQIKESQYVGFMGQAIRNRRCWDNCYRNKRTSKPGTSAQEVWFECWGEYLESMKDSKKWDKYASVDDIAKDKKWDKKFAEEVNNKMKKGMSLPESVYDTFNKEADKYVDTVIEQASNLTELAVALNNNGQKKLGKKVAAASNEVLKEAQFWQGVGDAARGIGGDIAKGFGKAKDWVGNKMQGYKEQGNERRIDKMIENIASTIEQARGFIEGQWQENVTKINGLMSQLQQYRGNPKVDNALRALRTWNANIKREAIDTVLAALRQDSDGDGIPDVAETPVAGDVDGSGVVEQDEAVGGGLPTAHQSPDQSAPMTPGAAPAPGAADTNLLLQYISADPNLSNMMSALSGKGRTNPAGITALQNAFQQAGVEFNEANRKQLMSDYRNSLKGQQPQQQVYMSRDPKREIYGKSLLRNILNKNKGILIN